MPSAESNICSHLRVCVDELYKAKSMHAAVGLQSTSCVKGVSVPNRQSEQAWRKQLGFDWTGIRENKWQTGAGH